MRPDLFVDLHKSFTYFFYLRPYLFTSLRTGLFCYQALGHKRQPNLALVFGVFILCYSIFCYRCMFAFAVLDLDLQY